MRRYSFREARLTDDTVFITDVPVPGSLTVAEFPAEAVRLVYANRPGKRIILIEQDGSQIELLHEDGEFTGTRPVGDVLH